MGKRFTVAATEYEVGDISMDEEPAYRWVVSDHVEKRGAGFGTQYQAARQAADWLNEGSVDPGRYIWGAPYLPEE